MFFLQECAIQIHIWQIHTYAYQSICRSDSCRGYYCEKRSIPSTF